MRWSAEIIAELRRTLLAAEGMSTDRADVLMQAMVAAFPEASVAGYAGLVSQMANDPGDRHVLAAAIVGQADVIVADNVRHFPEEAVEPYGVEVQIPDEVLSYVFDLAPGVVADMYLRQADSSLPSYDPEATGMLTQRVLEFLRATDSEA